MQLSSIQTRILLLQMKPVIMVSEGKDDRYQLYLDEIDNFISTLHGLPDKYLEIWRTIKSKTINYDDQNKANSEMNENIIGASKLLTSIHQWIESLKHFPGSPSSRSGNLSSIRNTELPKLLSKKNVDRAFIVDATCNFFDQIIEEFDEYKDKLIAYKHEFADKNNSESDNKNFRNWCKNFFEKVQVFFDNHCLENEYEWHIARLQGKGSIKRRYHIPPVGARKIPGGYEIPPPGVSIIDSPGASVVHASHVGGHSGGNNIGSDGHERGWPWWRNHIIAPLFVLLIGAYLIYLLSINGNRQDINAESPTQAPSLENKRSDELSSLRGSALITSWFSLMNDGKWPEACSLMAKEKCDASNADSILEHSKEPRFKTVDGYHLAGVNQPTNAPKDLWCVKYIYQERQSAIKRDIALVMQYHLLARSDGSQEIGSRLCERKWVEGFGDRSCEPLPSVTYCRNINWDA